VVPLWTTRFNIQKFYVLGTKDTYVFCKELVTKSIYFPSQYLVIGFYNREGVCLLRCANLVFIYNVVNNSLHRVNHNVNFTFMLNIFNQEKRNNKHFWIEQ